MTQGDLRRDTDHSAAERVARLAWFELAAAATRRSLAQEQAPVDLELDMDMNRGGPR